MAQKYWEKWNFPNEEVKAKYEARLGRIRKAVALEPVDKIPLLSSGPAANAKFAGVVLADYLADMELNCDCNLKVAEMMDIDGSQAPIFSPEVFPAQWFSSVAMPGKDPMVGPNELWQVHEKEIISQEDYDTILDIGYDKWQPEFLRTHFDHPFERSAPFFEYCPTAERRHAEAGFPTMVSAIFESPFEALCGGRSLATFLMDDLMEIPEKMDDVFDEVHRVNMAGYEALLSNPDTCPIGVWVGGWRGTPSMLNREMFERFSWRFMKDIANLCIKYGVIPLYHLDSNWTPGLDVFREIAPKTGILALDGKTDIFKAKEVLGDHTCIMGDVPAEMLAFGTPADTYNYSMKLIKEIGPTGFILCSGCDIPFNAKYENVEMMVKAVHDTSGKLADL